MDRLQAMRVFARVVDEGGFAAAARALDMSPPVVTRMVADLERHLGTRLLQRTTRKVALTDAGQAYLERVRAILFDIEDAEAHAAASTRELRGSLHVLAPPVLATYFLAPLVAPWRARYPRLLLDIATDNYVAARVDEFDVTFMVVPEDYDGNIVARNLFQGEAVVVASPTYLQRMGMPQTPADLGHHQYLRDSAMAMHNPAGRKLRLQHLQGQFAAQEVDMPHVALQSVSTELLLRAALDGVGVAVMARLLIEPYLASGALVHVLPDWMYSRYTVYAALPTRRMVPARTKAFLDFVTEQVPEAVALQRAAAGLGCSQRGAEGTAKPFWRQASNTVTATALDRFRLRWPVSMGRRSCCAGAKVSRSAGSRPRDSAPNTNQSPGSKCVSCTRRWPLVVRANMRCGSGWCVASKLAQSRWRSTRAYSW